MGLRELLARSPVLHGMAVALDPRRAAWVRRWDWLKWGGAQFAHYERKRRMLAKSGVKTGAPVHVMFLAGLPTAREAKLAAAAKLAGCRVTLLTTKPRTPAESRHVDAVVRVRNGWHALRELSRREADVVHAAISLYGDNARWVLDVLRHSPVPTVYDQYDVFAGMFRPGAEPPATVLALEKRCFETADHVCARSLEPRFLRREMGYRIRRATYFPEYCWTPPRPREPRSIGPEEELHVVYAGGIWPEDKFDPAEFCYAQYLEVGRAFAAQRLHLHLYPAPNVHSLNDFENFFSAYLAEAERNRFFHIYRPVPPDALLQSLATFDAAMHFYGLGIDRDLGRNSDAKRQFSSANKLFDFVEAGLPVFIHNGRHQFGVVHHFGTAIKLAHVREARAKLVAALARPNSRAATHATLAAQAGRLKAMYEKLAGVSDGRTHSA